MTIETLMNALKAMDYDFLSAVFDTLPVEFSLIDANDNVLFWNYHGTRIFKRGPAVIGRNVRMCHPADSIDKVNQVLRVLKSGERDVIKFWLDLPDGDTPRKVFIRYHAIRAKSGEYLGTLETTMNLTPLQGIEGEKRLGDFE